MKNAVIGGSKAYDLLRDHFKITTEIGEVQTPYGRSSPIYEIGDLNILFLSRHGSASYQINAPSVNYRANIYALKELGVERIMAWSGPGALKDEFELGEYIIPDDVIDETRGRPSTFYENSGLGFIRQNPVFCPQLSLCLSNVLSGLNYKFRFGGTYVCTQGPRLETPAEIRKFRLFGADLIGMTLVPEVFLAKELEICYVALCYITNYAEGVKQSSYKPGILFDGLNTEVDFKRVNESVLNFPRIIKELFDQLPSQRTCKCNLTMERYRAEGRIWGDWKTWLRH
jgi:5'-methylthioadenosine phosphorylase